jgi:hypothetical protein
VNINSILWFLQAILSIKFLSVAYSHGIRQDQSKMQQGIQKMGHWARPVLYFVAAILLLSSAGLILPAASGVHAWITPFIAAVLAGLMLLSILFHLQCREKPNILPSLILFALAAVVAYGRWILAPL